MGRPDDDGLVGWLERLNEDPGEAIGTRNALA